MSPDTAFGESIASRLAGWGLSVALGSDFQGLTPSLVAEEQVDVLLLDVRKPQGGILPWLASIKGAFPTLEVILAVTAIIAVVANAVIWVLRPRGVGLRLAATE